MLFSFILCVIGFILLYYGAEWLVNGASSLAKDLGITPIVIGLTVVAFGTSAPELVVSVVSSIKAKSMIAVGNVVGSNICNIALILGLSACFAPITCQASVIRRDIPIMLGVSGFLLLLSLDSTISSMEGTVLFIGVILYILMNYRFAVTGKQAVPAFNTGHDGEGPSAVVSGWKKGGMIIIGIAGVVGGAQLVVNSAVIIMTALGVDEKFIGLTIVAFGTSLPELATSVVAAIRKEMDISIGNLVGSNVFNILSVIGMAAMVRPVPIPGGFVQSGLVIDYAVMILISILPWVLMRKTCTLNRRGGVILLAFYGGYITYLIVKAG
jgi:cation:H+ antiporter